MRNISAIIVHCSATMLSQDISVETIREWHKLRGYNDIGYHFYITKDGKIHKGRDVEKIGAHARGHNANTIGICYEGGLDENMKPKDTRTLEQLLSMNRLIFWLAWKYDIKNIFGHDMVSDKSCPCFDAHKEYYGKVVWMSKTKGYFDEDDDEEYLLVAEL